MSHDYQLLDTLDQLVPNEFNGDLWRTCGKKRSPILGGTRGGRWSPIKQFEALYTSLDKDVCIAEIYYHFSQAPVFPSFPMIACKLQVKELSVLDLTTEKALEDLRFNEKEGRALISYCQNIGAAANFLEHQGIIVPSYRSEGKNCVLFSERLTIDQISVVSEEDIDWASWKRKNR